MSLNIVLLYYIYHLCFTCIELCCLSAWVLIFLNVCPFYYTSVAGRGKVGPVNQVNHTSWMAVVTPTDRPKSVRNRCVMELFVALFVLSLCPLDNSAGVEAFVIGLSQIFSFFSYAYILSLSYNKYH